MFRGCRPFIAARKFKLRQVLAHELPKDTGLNIFVTVAQHAADASDLGPWDVRVTGFHIRREMSAGLGDNLNAPLHESVPLPIRLEGVEGQIAHHRADSFGRFDHIAEAQNNRALRH
ncbi:MAG TPA: hypothetical protein VMB71_12600 [Acetobacteraceae bacterium]|nr:hypothetical protein [Acetobacteraceae bacterium]